MKKKGAKRTRRRVSRPPEFRMSKLAVTRGDGRAFVFYDFTAGRVDSRSRRRP